MLRSPLRPNVSSPPYRETHSVQLKKKPSQKFLHSIDLLSSVLVRYRRPISVAAVNNKKAPVSRNRCPSLGVRLSEYSRVPLNYVSNMPDSASFPKSRGHVFRLLQVRGYLQLTPALHNRVPNCTLFTYLLAPSPSSVFLIRAPYI